MLDKVDADGDGFIDFDEFKNSNMMHGEFDGVSDISKAGIHTTHMEIDTDNNRQITEEELIARFGEEGANVYLDLYDEDDNGVVTWGDVLDYIENQYRENGIID